MKLVAFDGDNTLWEPLDVVSLSERTPTDAVGWPNFAYTQTERDPLVVMRDDGARFSLRPETESALDELKHRNVLLGVVSYNHVSNVLRILHAFGVRDRFDYVVAEWHSDKDKMLVRMLEMARRDGHELGASDLILVDDDPYEIYRGQCKRIGAGFSCFGTDIHDLRQVLNLLDPAVPTDSPERSLEP